MNEIRESLFGYSIADAARYLKDGLFMSFEEAYFTLFNRQPSKLKSEIELDFTL